MLEVAPGDSSQVRATSSSNLIAGFINTISTEVELQELCFGFPALRLVKN
jgi:hypothetical protein